MEYLDWQLERFREGRTQPSFIWKGRTFTYGEIDSLYRHWRVQLSESGITPGSSVALVGDFSPVSLSCLFALMAMNCILVPLSRETLDQHRQFTKIAEIDYLVEVDAQDAVQVHSASERRNNPLMEQLRETGDPGLVLFTS